MLLGAALCLSYILSLGPPAVASGDSCSSSAGVAAHYLLDTAGRPLIISGVVLSGFDPEACDGRTVRITFSGNAAGDSAAPAVTLSVLDTSVAACRRDTDDPAVVIHEGSITVRGCEEARDAHKAAFVDVHDVTSIRVQVAGAEPSGGVDPQILGTQAIQNSAGMPNPAAVGDSLGVTGGPKLVAAGLGLSLLLLGVLALTRAHRLRN